MDPDTVSRIPVPPTVTTTATMRQPLFYLDER
jgi:hypothetical protein